MLIGEELLMKMHTHRSRALRLLSHTSECGPKGYTVVQVLQHIIVHIDEYSILSPFR